MYNANAEISPQIQNRITQLQQLQQQAQALAMQKSQTEIMIKEAEGALNELDKAKPDEVVYKSVGEILIRTDRDSLINDLKERSETLSLRLQSYERQEERLNSRHKELQEQLQNMLSGSNES
ncbi:MAG: prefoldin subunit beta [Methanosarcinaceae archaeon]|nr:prefoldin subunit beta [Methanosarcinaceae archaeon]